MTGRAPGKAEAERHLALGRERESAGRLEEALEYYRAAVQASPGHTAALLDLGSVLDALDRRAEAVEAFEAALASAPRDPFANYNLGRLLYLGGDLARSEATLRAALAAKGEFPEALVALASVLEARSDLEGALRTVQAAIAQRPGYAGALKNCGTLLGRLGRWAEAADALRQAAALDAGDAEALFWLGDACLQLNRPDLALQAFRDATGRQPAFAEAWCRQGNLLSDGGRQEDALACFSRALELRPAYAEAWLGLGNALGVGERQAEAAAHFRRALELEPRLALAHLNLGILLSSQGRQDEALAAIRAALALNPDWPDARWAYAVAHVPTLRRSDDDLPGARRRIAGAFDELGRWLDAQQPLDAHRAVGVQQPFGLAYQELDNRPLLELYGRICAQQMGRWQARQAPRPAAPRPRGKVRVGIVSQYLREHSVWHALVRGWFEQLDPARFSLIAFCLDPTGDQQTHIARARATRFEQGHIGFERWCEAIADARPDVLLYPEIGMDPTTLKLASLRLASLQAVSWGHPETSGLPTIDCYLSADGMEPPGADAHYSEKLVRLPHLGTWLARRDAAPRETGGERFGAAPGVPLLVSPGTPFKYAPEHDWIYPEIASRLGECRLVFFRYWVHALSDGLEARLRRAFAARGLPFERYVTFVPWQDRDGFTRLLGSADVFLDTLGFSGFNTALQAVDCALPLATLEGRFLRGRLASGILRRMGMPELVAQDAPGYVALAVRLARDAGARDALRRRMADSRAVLYEDLEPIRALERFLAQGW